MSSGGDAASSARASTSAFITMPGPPPAGVSSTVRCLSVACARMSTRRATRCPAASALPARLTPSGPGNISGKIVSTLARHMAMSRPGVGSLGGDAAAANAAASTTIRPPGDIDHRHRGFGERQHARSCRPAPAASRSGRRRRNCGSPPRVPSALPSGVDRGEPDQVGMVELVVRSAPASARAARTARMLVSRSAALRSFTPLEPRDQMILGGRSVSISKRAAPSSVSSGP